MNSKYQLPQDLGIPSPGYDQQLNTAAIVAVSAFDSSLASGLMPESGLSHLFVQKEMETTSKIEGTQVTFQDVVMSEDREDEQKLPNVLEALAVLAALKEGKRFLAGGIPVSNRFIKTMHEKLMVRARNSQGAPGEFRNITVSVGHRYFPPEPQYVEKLMSDLEKYIHNGLNISPIVKIAITHAQFEIIHPFADGNGRIGRLLIPFLMKEYEVTREVSFFISPYFEKNRNEYYSMLEGITKNNGWDAWISFFLHSVAKHGKEMKQKIDVLSGLYTDANFLKMRTADSQHLKNYIFKNPFFTVPYILRDFAKNGQKIPNKSGLHKILQSTGNLKVLIPGKGRRRTVYCCPEILDALY